MGSGEGLEPPFHDDKKSVSSSCRCATIYTSRFFVLIWNVQFSLHLDFQSFPCSPDCNVFDSACTDNSSFRCSSSAYLMQISWILRIACVLSPGHGIHWCSPVTSFPRILFCESICQRTTSPILFEPLPMQDCSCPNYLLYKVVDLPLHRSRYTRNGISKRVWLRRDSDPSTLVLGKRCSIQLSYSANLERTNQLKIRSAIHRCELS